MIYVCMCLLRLSDLSNATCEYCLRFGLNKCVFQCKVKLSVGSIWQLVVLAGIVNGFTASVECLCAMIECTQMQLTFDI